MSELQTDKMLEQKNEVNFEMTSVKVTNKPEDETLCSDDPSLYEVKTELNCDLVEVKTKLETPLSNTSLLNEVKTELGTPLSNMSLLKNTDNDPLVKKDPQNENNPELNLMYPANIPKDYMPKYETFLEKIEQLKIPIMTTVSPMVINTYRDYTTKFYTDKYVVDFNVKKVSQTFDDVLVRIHTNGVLLICLAPGNTILNSPQRISKINFEVNNRDRSKITVKGKKKNGAMLLMKESILCKVQLEGSSQFYNIRAGVQGRLVEFNHLIKSNPNIIKTDPLGLGFICIVLPVAPKYKLTDAIESLSLLNGTEYADCLLQRKEQKENN